jgi:hypothetical protein
VSTKWNYCSCRVTRQYRASQGRGDRNSHSSIHVGPETFAGRADSGRRVSQFQVRQRFSSDQMPIEIPTKHSGEKGSGEDSYRENLCFPSVLCHMN